MTDVPAGGGPDGFERVPFYEALTVEHAILRHAPHAGDAGAQMVALAHERAREHGPVVPNGRSFPREAREELADACNYLVWQRLRRELDGAAGRPPVLADEIAALDLAIAALANAWLALAAVPESP